MNRSRETKIIDKTLLIGVGEKAAEILSGIDTARQNVALIYIEDKVTQHPLEQYRLSSEDISGNLWSRVQNLMHQLNRGKSAVDEGVFPLFDVFVFGAFNDPVFLQHLPHILWVVKTVALHHFKSLFHVVNNIQNARFFIHPIGLSENLQLEPDKNLIIRQLAWIENYQKLLPVAEQFIPRFYLIDGFNSASSLTMTEIQQLLGNFFNVWISTPIRRQEKIRQLFGFSSYQNDFFSFLNIALLEFPIDLYKEYFGARLLNAFIRHFTSESTFSVTVPKPPVSESFHSLTHKWQPKKLYHVFEEPIRGFNMIERLKKAIPTFYFYEDPLYAQLSDMERKIKGYKQVEEIFLQKTYLPKIKKIYPQENLFLFFNQHWQSHVQQTLSPEVPGGELSQIVKKFYLELEKLTRQIICQVESSIQKAVEESLRQEQGKHRIHPLLNFLKKNALPRIRSAKKRLGNSLEKELPHLPDFISHEKLTSHLISFIRRLTRKSSLWVWFMLYAVILFPVVSLLLEKWVTSMDYDALNQPFIVSLLTPPFVYGVSAIVLGLLLSLILFLRNHRVKKKIFRYLGSSYPQLSKEIQEFGEIQTNKYENPADNKGVLAQSIQQLRKEASEFWQIILDFYIKQQLLCVYAYTEKLIQQKISELQHLIDDLENIRIDSERVLQKYAYYFPQKRKPQVYPHEQMFHQYFLTDDWFKRVFQHRFQFADEQDAVATLYKKMNLEELLERKHFSVKKEYIINLAMGLIDFKERNYQELFDPTGEKDPVGQELLTKLKRFLISLEQALTVGSNFTTYIVEEHDLQIVDSGIFLFYSTGLHQPIKTIIDEQELEFNLVPTSMRPYVIIAMRMIKDISLPSLVEHLELDYKVKEEWFDNLWQKLSEQHLSRQPEDIWQMFYRDKEKEEDKKV